MGIEWRVLYATPPDPATPSAWAVTRMADQTITLNPTLAPDHLAQTFLHELIHVVFFSMGLDVAVELNRQQNEILVNGVTNGLFPLMKDLKLFNV